MIELNIKDETATLKSVIVGSAESFGGTPSLDAAYDPKSKQHILQGTFPVEQDLIGEMEGLEAILHKHGVEVLRPRNIPGLNQVYSRDIGFVIDNQFVVSRVLENREHEIEGIDYLIDMMNPGNVIRPEARVRIEGGDVMPWKGKIFVGYSKPKDFEKYLVSRTNEAGVEFLKATFPRYEVHPFELSKSDEDPMFNALHLDCCFQPIGTGQAILFKEGFKNSGDIDFLREYFGEDNIVTIDRDQMYNMCSNIFSISPSVIVSEQNFSKLNPTLQEMGFTVEEIPYAEVAKMEGLMRCSTLPLHRE